MAYLCCHLLLIDGSIADILVLLSTADGSIDDILCVAIYF